MVANSFAKTKAIFKELSNKKEKEKSDDLTEPAKKFEKALE
jgi:hypothetical protein